MKKFILMLCIVCVSTCALAQTITQAEYFIDTDNGFGANTVVAWNQPFLITVNASSLTPGYHRLYFRTKDSDNKWSHTTRRIFEVVTPSINVVSVEYFFKNDLGFGACPGATFPTPAPGGTFSFYIPIDQIPVDSDTLFVRTKNSPRDVWSLTELRPVVITVPLTLLNFTAVKQNQQVHLNWLTENEMNTDHFNIQRSTDAVLFNTVGQKPAKGVSSPRNNYAAVDDIKGLSVDKIYYRLEMVDRDGRTSFSEIRFIKIDGKNGSLVIYPNPAQDYFSIIAENNINVAGATVVVRDLSGRSVLSEKLLNSFQRFNIAPLSKGIYTVSIITAEKTWTDRLFKK